MALFLDTIHIPDDQLSEDDLYRRVNRKEPVVLSGQGKFPDSLRTKEGSFSRTYDPRVFYIYDVSGPMPSMWPIDGYTARYEVIARTLGEAILCLWQMGKDLRFLNLSRELIFWNNGEWVEKRYYNWAGLGFLWDNLPDIDMNSGIDFTGCNFTNQRENGRMGAVNVNNMNFSHCILNNFVFLVYGDNYNLDNAMGKDIDFVDSKMKNTSQNGTIFINSYFQAIYPHKFDIKSYRLDDYDESKNYWRPYTFRTKEEFDRFYSQLFYGCEKKVSLLDNFSGYKKKDLFKSVDFISKIRKRIK